MARLTRCRSLLCLAALGLPLLATPTHAQRLLRAGALEVDFSGSGSVTSLRNTATGIDYLAPGAPAPFLTVVSDGRRHAPTSLELIRLRDEVRITLTYREAGVKVVVSARSAETHLAFEIVSATPADRVDAVIWGPYPTTIRTTIGEAIGVVRDSAVALGLQVLNMKTLGGDLPNDEGSTWARGIAAVPQPWGSALQAYAINRAKPRMVDAWGGAQKRMPVPPIPGETVVGSRIALFTCAEPQTLDRMEQIARAERLPFPTIDGVWFRKSPIYGRSYLISTFGESEVDEMLAYTKRAGLYSLYHEGPFRTWGHFVLSESAFPSGLAGMRRAVEKAHAMGLHFGVHTLTNFLTTNDAYVTPIPDPRLSVVGESRLTRAIDTLATTIDVASDAPFREKKENHLRTVRIGSELLQYDSVTAAAPWRLLGVTRGVFGTRKAAHAAGSVAGKLFDHPYKVFFPNFAMQREVARNLADFLNETGVDHIDFDGHEGALASGQGDYALSVFTDDVMRNVKHEMIYGTSISKTFYWHVGTYYNWGEPWYGGFRESMQQYRIDNQALFDRNFMPHMLGWYLLTDSTTMVEMEWMLARAAAYDAGFAMVARPGALRANPRAGPLLDAIREWEQARTRGAFSAAQRERLKNAKHEFHLATAGSGIWEFTEHALSDELVRSNVERQPGEPTASAFTFVQDWPAQPAKFRITVPGTTGSARTLRLQIDRHPPIELSVTLRAGESVLCDGSDSCHHVSASGAPAATIRLPTAMPMLTTGAHTVTLDSERGGDEARRVVLQFRGLLGTETVRARR